MIKIAICDDSKNELENILSRCKEYVEREKIKVSISTYSHPNDLFCDNKALACDIYILDVVMPMMTGIELAKEISIKNPSAKLVFCTTSKDFAVEAFALSALHYITKPIEKQDFEEAMKRVISSVKKRANFISLESDDSVIYSIKASDILYSESAGNYQKITTRTCGKIKVRKTVSALYEILSEKNHFVRCGKSYIVNASQISQINSKQIVIGGEEIFLPRGSYPAVRDAYFDYFCEEEEE